MGEILRFTLTFNFTSLGHEFNGSLKKTRSIISLLDISFQWHEVSRYDYLFAHVMGFNGGLFIFQFGLNVYKEMHAFEMFCCPQH